MRHTILLLALAGCVESPSDNFSPIGEPDTLPEPKGGKGDAIECGTESCDGELCGYDCTKRGSQCTESCAAADGRKTTFVASNLFDSRNHAYDAVLALDNVVIYGCELWDFSDQAKDGLEVKFEQLIHASLTVNSSDPTRHAHYFNLYFAPFNGPGSYKAEASYKASHDAPAFTTKDGCSVDVAADASGGITGAYDCSLKSQSGASQQVKGTFACSENSMDLLFTRWVR